MDILGKIRFLNTPKELADIVSSILIGKTVCDIGCRDGYFMTHMMKYAPKVIGIEIKSDYAQSAINKGLDVIIGDASIMKGSWVYDLQNATYKK